MLQNTIVYNLRSKTIGYLATDFLIICFIYLLPSLAHLTAIPFYLFDPMRLALVFCIIFTDKKNSIVIALTLPVISLLISSHPALIKSIIISAELVLNVLAFYFLSTSWKNQFITMFVSILIAKVFYYSTKITLFSLGFIQGDLVSTPIWIQCMMLFLLSIFTFIFLRNTERPATK